jgi:hypothetical protein
MVDLEHYEGTVCEETWRVISEIASEVKDRKLRISFFNSTPQGGGGKFEESSSRFHSVVSNPNINLLVALMRHALIRCLRLMGIDANCMEHHFLSTFCMISYRLIMVAYRVCG